MTEATGGRVMAILSGVSAILLAWIGVAMKRQSDSADRGSKRTQEALGQLAEDRQRTTGQRDVELKVYEAVVGALQEGSERRQTIARSLVNAMVVDTLLQRGLLQALQQQAVPAVRESVAQDLAFDQSTRVASSIAADAGSAGISRIDLFWCESSGRVAQNVMLSARQRLIAQRFPEKGIRVRPLPVSINSRPGYNVSGYQVRFESGEQTAAERVRQELQAVLPQKQAEVAMVTISAQTPGYLSAFACPLSGQG